MTSNISLNQFAPNQPLDGLYVYMANEGQLHNVIVGADTTLKAGDVVELDTSSVNVHAPVVLANANDAQPFGVVSYTPTKASHISGNRIGLAREHDVIWKKAAEAIAVGDLLTWDSDFQVLAANASDYYIGVALTPAFAEGDFVQVELKFGQVAGE